MPLIEIKDLEKIYTTDGVKTPALEGVSLSIEPGEFLAIMGPSGSGKSTLLHILGFLDDYTKGEYRLDGKIIDNYSKEEIAQIRNQKMGFIFQSFNLLPRATVFENIKLPLIYSQTPEKKWVNLVIEAISSVGLSHRLDYEASRLSGGEKQRVAIARALVNNPQVIFADEPTGNLDSKSGQIIMDIIQKLSIDQKRTVILVTHETYTSEYAERIITLKDGRMNSDRKVTERHIAGDKFHK